MKTKTPEKTNGKIKKKTPKKLDDDKMQAEIINMDTSPLKSVKTPKTPFLMAEESSTKSSKKRKSTDSNTTTPKKQSKLKEKGSKKLPTKAAPTPTSSTKSQQIVKKKKNSGKNKKGKFITLFIGALDTKVTRETVREFFENHGVNLYEVRRKNGRRFCHVDLLNPEDLEKALALNGKKIDGSKVKINAEKKHFDTREIEVKSQTLFVKNIESTVSKDALRDVFPEASSIKYPKTESGKNKGFAYVQFESIEKVKEYLTKKKNLELRGQKLILDTVEKGTRHSKILRVRNLDFETTKETIEEVFDGCNSVKICLNNVGKSQGTAIVTFESIEAAKTAQKEKHKTEVDGRKIIVTFIEEEEQPAPKHQKKFGKEDRWGRKKSSSYEKRRKPQNMIKKPDSKQKSFKKSPTKKIK
ncbi:hypothetical protein SNE40_005277 [Patella caerulea]|uniref:RRM domain-containing protein n=1 Tax=Patella caerulea TaxID=87958 RepID=A0AAN8PX99_PATCE